MNRKNFIRSTALGVGSVTLGAMLSSCQNQAKEQSTTPEEKPEPIKKMKAKIVKQQEGHKLNVIGDNQTIKLTGEDTNGQFTLIEQFNDPGVGIPPHVHEDEDEVFQVLSGEVEMMVGDKTTTLSAGDLIFCPRGVPHSWRVAGEEKARAMLSIFPAGLEAMFEELAQLPPGPPDLEKVGEICGKYNLKFV